MLLLREAVLLQINENGTFVTPDGVPVDREGTVILGEIDPATGFIMGEDDNGTMVNFGPNGMQLPAPESLSPMILVQPDGVPRNTSGVSPTPCGRMSSGCIGPPGTTITQYGIPVDPEGMPLLRDGTPIPGATGLNADGFVVGEPEVLLLVFLCFISW